MVFASLETCKTVSWSPPFPLLTDKFVENQKTISDEYFYIIHYLILDFNALKNLKKYAHKWISIEKILIYATNY